MGSHSSYTVPDAAVQERRELSLHSADGWACRCKGGALGALPHARSQRPVADNRALFRVETYRLPDAKRLA